MAERKAAGVLSVAIGAAVATGALAYAPAPVVFDTPAADEKGAMILGNGEVGALAWKYYRRRVDTK